MICPYCKCEDACGRETYVTPVLCDPRVFEAVIDLFSKGRTVIYVDPLYLAQDLVLFGYFPKSAPPRLLDVGHAQDLVREVEEL